MAVEEQLDRAELLRRLGALIDAVDTTHPTRVAIDGPDAVGKTTLADELAVVLDAAGREVIRASIDGFHRPRAERYRRGPDSPEGYYEDSFDYDALRRSLLEPLGPGGSRDYCPAVFDFRNDRPAESSSVRASARSVMLVDGVFLLRPELREAWDFSVFVSAGFDEVLRRALGRDLGLFGSADELERRYRIRYIPAQRLYFVKARPELAADAVVVNDDPTAPLLRVG
jgi:uridine kinase